MYMGCVQECTTVNNSAPLYVHSDAYSTKAAHYPVRGRVKQYTTCKGEGEAVPYPVRGRVKQYPTL